MTRISVSSDIRNPTIGELKAFLARIPASADASRLRISVTRDRPFDGEDVSIQATWEQELETPEDEMRKRFDLKPKEAFDGDKHNGVGITGLDLVEGLGKLPPSGVVGGAE